MVSRDRGQLILVGAIAIALILLGLVLIVNTALFTQVVGSEGTVESAKEGGVSGHEIGNAIGAVVAQGNLNHDSRTDINDSVDENVTDHLQPALANRSIDGSGSFVSLDYLGPTEDGTVIEQDSYRALDDGWSLTDGDVGRFLVTVDTVDSPNDEFNISVDPNNGPARELKVDVVSDNEISLSGAKQSGCSNIEVTNQPVRINAQQGRVYESSTCSFELFSDSASSFDVSFKNGDDVNASYVLVTNKTSVSPLPNGATASDAIWAFAYEFTYETPDATIESDRREVDVYD